MADMLGPSAIPLVIGLLLAACGAAVMTRGFTGGGAGTAPRAVPERNELQGKASTWRGMAAVGVTVFLSLALPILGLLPSMPIALALLMFIMAGTDRWPVVVLAALVLTAAVYGIFGLGLGVDIPLVPSQHA
ncbi:MAG TPA: tripartite tricarboxylate transporter TctB family protein [Chloroflexota bacterium]